MSKTSRWINIWIYSLSILLTLTFYLVKWIQGWTGVILAIFGILLALTLLGLLIIRLVALIQHFNLKLLAPFIVGILPFLIVYYQPVKWLIERSKSPVLFSGFCEHTVTEVYFVFREQNEFEYNAGAFLQSEMYYGTYEMNNDTIRLNFNNSPPDNVNPTLVLNEQGFIEIGDTTRHRHSFKFYKNNLKTPVSNKR